MSDVPRVLVWGAGGHGRVVADLALERGWDLRGFVDADINRLGEMISPFTRPIVATEEQVMSGAELAVGATAIVPGIGTNAARLQGVDRLAGRCAPALIHPRATMSRLATVGEGTVVLAGAIINPGAKIGRGVIVNTGAIVEHDCVVEDGVHLSPGAVLTGAVSVGRLAWIGANATVLPGIRIGCHATVGAGAVVRRTLEDGVTAAGNPARVIHRNTR